MRAGALRERLTLERASESRGDAGAAVVAYTPVGTVWAAIEPLRGREYFESQAVQAEVTTRIRMRYREGVEPKMRLRSADGRTWEIEAVIDIEERHRELHLMCVERV